MFTCIIATLEWNSNQLLNESPHVVRITNYSDSKTKANFVMISKQMSCICFKIDDFVFAQILHKNVYQTVSLILFNICVQYA